MVQNIYFNAFFVKIETLTILSIMGSISPFFCQFWNDVISKQPLTIGYDWLQLVMIGYNCLQLVMLLHSGNLADN